jgi:hypothetical protein
MNLLKGLQLIKHARLNNGPKSPFLTNLKKQAMPLPKSWQKKMKSQTISEPEIVPACCKIVNIVFGEGYEKEILKIPT